MNQLKIKQRNNYHLSFTISTTNPFFKNNKSLVMEFDEYGVSFRVAGFDEEDTVTVYRNGLNGSIINVHDADLKEGTLEFDELINDELIYFNYE